MTNWILDRLGWFLMAAGAAFLALSFYAFSEVSAKYRKDCEEIGGKPLYNGKFYECIREPQK
jgi:hypothetical protein